MSTSEERSALHREHTPSAIRRRMREPLRPRYLPDAVLGGIDGGVTTFAIAAAAVGGGLSGVAVVILGIANLIADGFSMAASNFLAARSEREERERVRREEERHIRQIPEGEREEVRQIFAAKGFSGPVLDEIVGVITSDRRLWVDTMLVEEHGLPLASRDPLRAALATFAAFALIGLLPLLPFLIAPGDIGAAFVASIALTAAAFAAVGALKGRVSQRSVIVSALQTLAIGALAAAFAFFAGHVVRAWYTA